MSNLLKTYFQSFSQLFFPKICVACSESLTQQEETICLLCQNKLPFTNFYALENNPLQKKFWGRIELQKIDSFLFFEKDSTTQHLLHQLKYANRQDVGTMLGSLLGEKYATNNTIVPFNCIVSVPLHQKKLKRRGYNQCDTFAQKLSEEWHIPYFKNALKRNTDTKSQTGKSRTERWDNVAEIFSVIEPEKLRNKHVLLIDDVLTTGATVEACGMKILEMEDTKLSVLTMACKI